MELGDVDNIIFGKDSCHSFLVLQNPDGDIVSEIHGTTFSPKADRVSYGGGSAQSFLRSGLQMIGIGDVFERIIKATPLSAHFARLKVVVSPGQWRFDKSVRDRTVMRGTADFILPKWADACRMGEEVNKKDLLYVPICLRTTGKNCNSITSLMLDVIGARVAKHDFHLAAHGYNNPLPNLRGQLNSFERTLWSGDAKNMMDTHVHTPDGLYSRYKERMGPPG